MAKKKQTEAVDPLRLARQAVIDVLESSDTTASEKIAAANFIEKITTRDPAPKVEHHLGVSILTEGEFAELGELLDALDRFKAKVQGASASNRRRRPSRSRRRSSRPNRSSNRSHRLKRTASRSDPTRSTSTTRRSTHERR